MAQSKEPAGRKSTVRNARNASSRPLGFYLILGAVAAAGVGGLAYAALKPSGGPTVADAPVPTAPGSDAARGYLLGDSSAPVQIVEFADFECPSCARFATITEPDVRTRIIETGQANLTYFDLPLPQHLNSQAASNAAACADDQGKFWAMHDQIYARQHEWSTYATDKPKGPLKAAAQAAGLDVSAWEACFDARRHQARIDANAAEAARRGVRATPTFFIGGKMYTNAITYDAMKAAVDSARAAAAAAGSGATP
ncbi:MAG TPA: thioredoxin domain-containing protein [Gemmatimonadaceae bacterium]|nr:thioredoxin domain-containing protein [Gemmatimonadaceae bacterium]